MMINWRRRVLLGLALGMLSVLTLALILLLVRLNSQPIQGINLKALAPILPPAIIGLILGWVLAFCLAQGWSWSYRLMEVIAILIIAFATRWMVEMLSVNIGRPALPLIATAVFAGSAISFLLITWAAAVLYFSMALSSASGVNDSRSDPEALPSAK